jgi:hypothetical protein
MPATAQGWVSGGVQISCSALPMSVNVEQAIYAERISSLTDGLLPSVTAAAPPDDGCRQADREYHQVQKLPLPMRGCRPRPVQGVARMVIRRDVQRAVLSADPDDVENADQPGRLINSMWNANEVFSPTFM